MMIAIPSHLSDDELVARLRALAQAEREATALVIAHLAEFDGRRLYLGAGFSSLLTYCCEVLLLPEPAAYNRIEVARAVMRFPPILSMLGEGLLSLATVRLLAPHLTAENQQELLAEAVRKSKRAVEEMLVRHFPRPEVPFSVRRLPGAKSLLEPPRSPSSQTVVQALPAPARRPGVALRTPERYAV